MKIRLISSILVAFLSLSCASVHVGFEPSSNNATNFVHHSHYGLFGLIGSDRLDQDQICAGKKLIQVHNYFSFEDMLFAVSTIGLYTPKSLRVWCDISMETEGL